MAIMNNGITNSLILLSQAPLSERMKTATLNTVLGIGFVFLILALIILIISFFKFLPGNKAIRNADKKATETADNISADNNSYEETDLTDDKELVAVITAAISAFCSDVNPDDLSGGFVVRSIRKIDNRRIK